MKNHDVVALGIAVMDILAAPVDKMLFEYDKTPVDSVILAPGGDAANQAAHLARLGWRTALCCRLGDDALSRMFAAELNACGVDLSHAAVSAESVMTAAIVLVAADGQRSILHRRGNNYDFCRDDVDLDIIADARALTVGSIFGCPKMDEDGLEEILIHAKRHDVLTFADMATDKRGAEAGRPPSLPAAYRLVCAQRSGQPVPDGWPWLRESRASVSEYGRRERRHQAGGSAARMCAPRTSRVM